MRYLILLASILMQTCVGGLYAWSSFVPALHDDYHLTMAQTQVLFGFLIAIFTLTTIYSGRLLHRRGPRLVASLGGLLFALGYLIASYSQGSFLGLFIGISLVAGVGTGFCYVCPLVMCVKWFPRQQGLATGLAVAGFGGGAILLSNLAEMFFDQGYSALDIMRFIGIAYGLVILTAALLLRFPPTTTTIAPVAKIPTRRLLGDSFFRALVVAMFCGTFAGLLVIGNLKPLALSLNIDAHLAAVAISGFAIGNATGRIVWGVLVDRLKTRVIPLSLLFLLLSLLLLLIAPATIATVFVSQSILVGLAFGASFVIHAALVSSHFGADRVARIYPFIFVSYGFAGIAGPFVGGWLYDLTHSYTPGLIAAIIVVILGLLLSSQLLRRRVPVGSRF